ncbi:MAG: DNA methyltransferase [Chloroflexi bacterium]|nr:DNA methyltransferase [Chloroflexota bacterium]
MHKAQVIQSELPLEVKKEPVFPSTRFQGSKAKLVDWIWDSIQDLDFDTALDAFGGTGAVSHLLKRKEKRVTYNDSLKFNYFIGLALIENEVEVLSDEDVDWLLERHDGIDYRTTIQDTFREIYYTDEENAWLDQIVSNITHLTNPYKQALAYFALFQACIIKRPFNLFHRKNLYIRFRDVKRSFGNKVTWDKPFDQWFRHFVSEANGAVFDNGRKNKAINLNPLQIPGAFDLVYIDTPYISEKGVGVDYLHFYHFLEGLTMYTEWPNRINYGRKHRPLKTIRSEWVDKNRIHDAFTKLFDRYKNSILVVSYRDNGIPSEQELFNLLRQYKQKVIEVKKRNYKYVLSTYSSSELLFIAP